MPLIGPRRFRFLVEVEVPRRASHAETKQYVADAISEMKGSLEPPNEDNNYTGNPLWELRLTKIRKTRKRGWERRRQ